jgi:RHS repeat-associated protein
MTPSMLETPTHPVRRPSPGIDIRRCLLPFFVLLPLFGQVQAYHFPWDQGHDTFTPVTEPETTDPGPGTCKASGSPFEVASGNLVYETNDLFIASLGAALELNRVYNSQDRRQGPFGAGWSTTYDQRLIETTNGDALFAICRQGNGKRERFVRNANGSFTPPPALQADLVKLPDGTFTLTEPDGTQRRFNASGLLTAVSDNNGNTLTVSYDGTGFITALTDASGRQLLLTKGANGKVASVTDPAARVLQYTYDAQGNLASYVDALGNTTEYVYDDEHNLVRVTDPRGNVMQQATYDANDRVTSYREEGQTWSVAYSPSEGKTTKTDGGGNVWTFYYNEYGNITRTTDPAGNEVSEAFGSNLFVSTSTDQNGDTQSYTYDADGRMTGITDASGNTAQIAYDPSTGHATTLTDRVGNVTRFEYDGDGNLVRIVDPFGNVTTRAYNSSGQLVSETGPGGQVVSYAYDTYGNLAQVTDPVGDTTSYTYDVLGNLTSITDGLGNTTQYSYDAGSRLTTITDAAGQAVGFTYDAAGNLLTVTDQQGNVTTFTYDGLDRVIRTTNPLGDYVSFAYDAAGNLASKTNARGQTISYSYDALGRRTGKSSPDDTVTFGYDSGGRLVSVSNDHSTVTLAYDANSRLVEASTAATAVQPQSTISYAYDARGNLATLTYPDGSTATYTHDARRQLTGVTGPAGQAVAFSYNASGQRTSIDYPNGVSTGYSYDSAGQVTRIHTVGVGTVADTSYAYDGVGNITTMALQRAGLVLAPSVAYTYDSLGQLTQASGLEPGSPAETFTYDAGGNRLRRAGDVADALYDAANRLLSDADYDYTYDADNNMVSRTAKSGGATTTFAYDAENRLVQVASPTVTVDFRYDGLGRRIEKRVTQSSVTTIARYLYDESEVLLELDGSNQVVARYTLGNETDEPLIMERAGQTYYYHADALGSIAGMTDGSGSVVQSYGYSAFGAISAVASVSFSQPHAFTGREYDPSTGLYYYRARYYDPRLGRFVSDDPLGFMGGTFNLARYVGNNPVNFTDPTGELEPVMTTLVIVGGGMAIWLGESVVTQTWRWWKGATPSQKLRAEIRETERKLRDKLKPAAGVGIFSVLTSGNACVDYAEEFGKIWNSLPPDRRQGYEAITMTGHGMAHTWPELVNKKNGNRITMEIYLRPLPATPPKTTKSPKTHTGAGYFVGPGRH